jgi:putative peptide zinc metalloprotease protein
VFLKVPLLRDAVVGPPARALSWLYATPVAVVLLLTILAAHLAFYFLIAPSGLPDLSRMTARDGLTLALLGYAGLIIHEFGHAAAAARFGCRRLEIGFAMYLYIPVMYTDLSDAWKLPRKQRAVVDFGGVYFQGIYLAVLLGVYLVTGNAWLLTAFLFSDLTIAASLNPFLRLDGYWVISDLAGIANLRAQSSGLMLAVWTRLWRPRSPFRWPVSSSRAIRSE